MRQFIAVALAALGLGAAGSALALELDLTGAFAFDTSNVSCTGGLGCNGGTFASIAPEGLAHNPVTDTLIVSHDGGSDMLFYEFNLDGTFTDPANPARFGISLGAFGSLPAWRGLDYLQSSGTLLASSEDGMIREFTLDGMPVAGGIDFVATGADDAEGVVLHTNGNIYVADDGNETVRQFQFNGASWVEVIGGGWPVMTRVVGGDPFDDPSAIETLPGGSGNLLVHDDSSGGLGSVWELSLDGMFLDQANSVLLTANVPGCDSVGGCFDGEGLAYDDVNDVVFIAYENEQKIISFPRMVPEPASASLLLLGIGGLIAARRRRA